MTTRWLVGAYRPRWNPERVVPSDPALADAVFEAGFQSVRELGAYSRTTERINEFEPGELEAGIQGMPQQLETGEGKDVRTLFARKITDERPSIVWAGNPGVPTPERLFLPMVMSWMHSFARVIVGGLGGDAPGSAVVNVASFILANPACLVDYHICHPIDMRHVATTTRLASWVESMVEQAFARNASCIIVSDIYPKSRALRRELLHETIANAIVISVTGGHLEGCGSADGIVPYGTGLEARLRGEVGHAVTRQDLSREEVNTLVLALLEKCEHVFDLREGNDGVLFDPAYDTET